MHDLILIIAGVIVGAMNGIAGGGMLVGFPILMFGGLSAIGANATGYIASLPGQLASAIGYRKALAKVPKRYIWLLIPCVIGATIGTLLLRVTDASSFDRFVPYLVLLAVALLAFQTPLNHYVKKHLIAHAKLPHRPLLIMSVLLLPLTVYGGYFGPGFGFILLAFLSFTRFNRLHQINGLKNVAATVMLLTSIIVLAGSNLIDWRAGIMMAIGSVIGGYISARYIQKISGRKSRIIVIIIGILSALYLVIA